MAGPGGTQTEQGLGGAAVAAQPMGPDQSRGPKSAEAPVSTGEEAAERAKILADDDQNEAGPNAVDTSAAAAAAGEINPDKARYLLRLSAAGNRAKDVISHDVVSMKDKAAAEKDPNLKAEKMAFAMDLEIANLQWRQDAIREKAHELSAKGKKIKKGLEDEFEGLSKQIKALQEQRSKGEIEVTKADGKTETVNIDLSKEKNQVKGFAVAMGADEAAAERSPLGIVQVIVTEAVKNKDFRDSFIKRLHDQEDKGDQKGLFKKEDVDKFERYLKSEIVRKSLESKSKMVAKGAGLVGAFMLMMAWLANKKREQG